MKTKPRWMKSVIAAAKELDRNQTGSVQSKSAE